MSDIGLLPAGANALFSALAILVIAALSTLGASLRAWLRCRRLARPVLDDPATAYAGAGAAATLLAFALAIVSSEASLETREALDVWWLPCAAAVLLGAVVAGWSVRRLAAS